MTNEGPVALVTGGASGIGESVASRWVRDGGRVAVLDINEESVNTAVQSLGEDVAFGVVGDVRSASSVASAVERAVGHYQGQLDAVVNSAGIAKPVSAAYDSDEEWSRLVDIHLNGTMRVCRSAYPYLKKNEGSIVNISSVAASNGLPGRSNYCAAKSGVEGLTRGLAVEWSPEVRVNTVAPGYVQTSMIDRLVEEGSLDTRPVVARTPKGRFAAPDELASAIVFLASATASYITGTVLKVDGGMSIEGNWYATGRAT